MRIQSEKSKKAEKFVDEYTIEHGYPPTYEDVGKFMQMKSRCSAHGICKRFRHKMKHNVIIPEREEFVKMKLEFAVPVSNMDEFSVLLIKINQLLKTKKQ